MSRSHTYRIGLAALVAGALLASACGGGDDGGSAATTTVPAGSTTTAPAATTTSIEESKLPPCKPDALGAGPVEITFWHAMGAENGKVLEQLVNTYNSSQTKVKVKLQAQTGYDDAFDKYRTASKDDRPDLIQLPEYYLQIMADSQTTVPAESCLRASNAKLDGLLERPVAYYQLYGIQQSVPFNISTPVLFYNRGRFTKAGLDPAKPPADLTALQAAAKAIVDKGAAKYGIALESSANAGGGWFVEQFNAKAARLYADNENGRSAKATKVLFNSAESAADLAVLGQMVKDGTAFNVGENADGRGQLLKMADQTEPAAMSIYSSAGIGPVVNLLKGGSFPDFTVDDLGVGPFPGPAGPGGVVVGGASLWLVKDKGDERTAAAWDFVKYLTSAQAQSTWAAGTGYIPVNEGALEVEPLKSVYAGDPRFKVAYDQLLTGTVDAASAGVVIGPLRQVRGETAKAVAAILGGGDAKAALDAAAAEADKLIKDYNDRTGG
ncbi:MAG TPA: extracellular solute-binding protein [Acidimicrobiales bacterium]